MGWQVGRRPENPAHFEARGAVGNRADAAEEALRYFFGIGEWRGLQGTVEAWNSANAVSS